MEVVRELLTSPSRRYVARVAYITSTNVRDVMTARPRYAAPDTPLSHVAELMETDDIGAIPILDGDRFVGMITDRDIVVRAVAKEKDPRGLRGVLPTLLSDSTGGAPAARGRFWLGSRRRPKITIDGWSTF